MRWPIFSVVLIAFIMTGGLQHISKEHPVSGFEATGVASAAKIESSRVETITIEAVGADELGPVYMYGQRLTPPYVFSGIGSDTLLLNGYPVLPKRTGPHPFTLLSKTEQDRLMEKARRSHASDKQKGDSVRTLFEAGYSYEECLEIYIELWRDDPNVESVIPRSNGVRVTYINGEWEEVTLPRNFSIAAPYDAYKTHMRFIEKFEPWVRSGNMVAIGFAGGLQYNLWTPKVQLEKTNKLLARLAAGDTLTRDDVINTPLTNTGFRIQMSKSKSRMKPREE
jgi:hypothetical protein